MSKSKQQRAPSGKKTAGKQTLEFLSRKMASAASSIDFELPEDLEGPPNWWKAKEPEGEGNPVSIAVSQIIGNSRKLARQDETVHSSIDMFRDALRPGHQKLWVSVADMLGAQLTVKMALAFNLGVEDGRTMQAATAALDRAGVDVQATEPTHLFQMALVLRDMARDLDWRPAPPPAR